MLIYFSDMSTTLDHFSLPPFRYIKELHSYEKEVETEVKRLKKMQEDEKDEYKLKYQVGLISAILFLVYTYKQ